MVIGRAPSFYLPVYPPISDGRCLDYDSKGSIRSKKERGRLGKGTWNKSPLTVVLDLISRLFHHSIYEFFDY